jgi:hypothetical protein
VLAFLATRPELAELVRTVTMGTVDEAGVPHPVALPPRAAELIELSPEPAGHEPGEDVRTATLNWPDWL